MFVLKDRQLSLFTITNYLLLFYTKISGEAQYDLSIKSPKLKGVFTVFYLQILLDRSLIIIDF
jgi:hypothetical protein